MLRPIFEFWIFELQTLFGCGYAALGVSVVTFSHVLLPWGLAFAGGAMLFVISSEIIPETHRHGHPMEATFGVIFGFIVMTLFDNLFV
jgi:zinc transporter, ZIP family